MGGWWLGWWILLADQALAQQPGASGPSMDQMAQGLASGNVAWIILALLSVIGALAALLKWTVNGWLAEKDLRIADAKASKDETKLMLTAHATAIDNSRKILSDMHELMEEKLGPTATKRKLLKE